MIDRWMLRFAQVFVLCSCLDIPILSAADLNAYLVVRWEGSALEEPNLEALDAIHKKYPDAPMIHLINPTYFQDNALTTTNLEKIKKRIGPSDEVGLYLVPSANLLKAAGVIAIHKPTFWGYSDELCTTDCGLQISPTVYSRTEVAKLFVTANRFLKEAGFNAPKTYAVHGWMAPAGLAEIAEGLDFTSDLTAIDVSLVKEQIREYPLANWLKSSPAPLSKGALKAYVQGGGIMEFNSDSEVLKRFDQFFAKDHERQALFVMSLSQENAYMTRSRLEHAIDGMKAKAAAGGDNLVFSTMNDGKNGRPLASKAGINTKL
ncbi:MAG: hypothetical protein H7249_17560 [Chitinophagaceae bacterium]|nr:hypothetical protein [Oligoflexus sp.]